MKNYFLLIIIMTIIFSCNSKGKFSGIVVSLQGDGENPSPSSLKTKISEANTTIYLIPKNKIDTSKIKNITSFYYVQNEFFLLMKEQKENAKYRNDVIIEMYKKYLKGFNVEDVNGYNLFIGIAKQCYDSLIQNSIKIETDAFGKFNTELEKGDYFYISESHFLLPDVVSIERVRIESALDSIFHRSNFTISIDLPFDVLDYGWVKIESGKEISKEICFKQELHQDWY